MFRREKPPLFQSAGKKEVSLTMRRIASWDDLGYGLSGSHFAPGEIEGGHEANISGIADEYWRGSEEIRAPKLRMHASLKSDLSRLQFERGILGGGQFHTEYVDIELVIEPDRVRDIVNELRLSHSRQLYVNGYLIGPIIFRVTRFGLSEPREG